MGVLIILGKWGVYMKYTSEQYLFCDKADQVVTLTVEHELQELVGGNMGYACHSVSCSIYCEHGCSTYGISNECNALISKAKKLAKDNLLDKFA